MGFEAIANGQVLLERLVSLIRRLAAETRPRRVPSTGECTFCDITRADCPEQVEG